MKDYNEYEFKNDFGMTLVVVNKYGDGMQFKYDLSNHCYSMSIVGDITSSEVKRLIEKYANN